MTLPPAIGKQKEVVTLTPEGHVVVLGTAGSGKTMMAIHRAAYVADDRADHGGPTLLVTFNRTLVTYLEHLRPPELRNVDVRTYHQRLGAVDRLLARHRPSRGEAQPAVRQRRRVQRALPRRAAEGRRRRAA